MIDEIRNELLSILYYVKGDDLKDKEFHLKYLLDRFESDIKRQLGDLESKRIKLENNLETLEYVKKELGIEK